MTGQVVAPGAGGTDRLHALDAVRAGALLLGIVFHAAMPFLPGPQVWVTRDPSESVFLGHFWFVAHMFRMSLFFMMAGFFARLVLHRKGWKAFARDRLIRIGVPLVVFWPISIVTIIGGFIVGAIMMYGPAAPPAGEATTPQMPTASTFPLTHLWFLYVLLLFYAIALPVRGLVAAVDRAGRLRALADRAIRFLVSTHLAPLALAVPVWAAFTSATAWLMWSGVPTPETGLVPNAVAMVTFGLAFTFGWLLQRSPELLQAWCRTWPAYLALAGVLTLACIWLLGSGGAPVLTPAPKDRDTVVFAACYALAIWCWSFGFIGLAMRFLSEPRPAVRYLADASYWLYLIHIPVVIALQLAVYGLAWPAMAKFALVLVVALPLMLASYHTLVRYTFVGWLLNGRKRTRTRPAATAVAVS